MTLGTLSGVWNGCNRFTASKYGEWWDTPCLAITKMINHLQDWTPLRPLLNLVEIGGKVFLFFGGIIPRETVMCRGDRVYLKMWLG